MERISFCEAFEDHGLADGVAVAVAADIAGDALDGLSPGWAVS
jgi:hypothetical protein